MCYGGCDCRRCNPLDEPITPTMEKCRLPATGLALNTYSKNFGGIFQGEEDFQPVYKKADVEAWLETHLYPRQYNHTAHNGVIDDLLGELRGGGA